VSLIRLVNFHTVELTQSEIRTSKNGMSDQTASEKVTNDRSEKKSIGGELIIPLSALFFTLYYFYTIIDTPWTAQVSAFFVGTVLILLIIAYLIKTGFALHSGKIDLGLGDLIAPVSFVPKRLMLLGLTILYIWTIEYIGFTIAAFIFLFVSMFILGEGKRILLISVISTILSIGGYFLFIVAFKTRFPFGPFETFMQGWL